MKIRHTWPYQLGILAGTMLLGVMVTSAQNSAPAGTAPQAQKPPAAVAPVNSTPPAVEVEVEQPAAPIGENKQLPSVVLGKEPVQTLYVVPMRNHMNDYLARELAKWGRLQVTLIPKEADAFLSDSPQINVQSLLQENNSSFQTKMKPGNIFMISTKTEKILWATGKPLTSHNPFSGPKTVESMAEEMIDQLKHDVEARDKQLKKEAEAQSKGLAIK